MTPRQQQKQRKQKSEEEGQKRQDKVIALIERMEEAMANATSAPPDREDDVRHHPLLQERRPLMRQLPLMQRYKVQHQISTLLLQANSAALIPELCIVVHLSCTYYT